MGAPPIFDFTVKTIFYTLFCIYIWGLEQSKILE